ncbi:MAG: radical SAM protein [Flavobacteriales bacterium]|nr:radical SAM protein [Flavobacteriales bacterium]
MEHFHTVQGEGAFSGQAAFFIRLGGCDVGCTWCDVKESWEMDEHPRLGVDALVAEALQRPARIAVVTGGEPLMHDLTTLTNALREAGFRTHLETSGTHPITGTWDWVCLSPKKFKAPLEGMHLVAHELKVIVFNKHDLQWAEEHAARMKKGSLLFLQPEWGKREAMMPLIVEHVQGNTRWRISIQTHKYMGIP